MRLPHIALVRMGSRDLATKFLSHAQYVGSREWAREWATLPLLVCFAPDIAQERRVQRVAQVDLPPIAGLIVWTTTEGMLKECGPLAPIWSCGMLASDQIATPSGSRRQLLFHLQIEKKDMRRC
jgi:hypothetical protein